MAAWDVANAQFEAFLGKAEAITIEQIEWEKLQSVATRHGLEAVDRLGESVVMGVAKAADRRFDASLGQTLCVGMDKYCPLRSE